MAEQRQDEGLGERLKLAIEKRKISQGDLEKAAGLSDGYLSRIINGSRPNVGYQTLLDLARGADVSVLWLMTGAGSMGQYEAVRFVEYDARYPNFNVAAEFARREGLSAEAIERVGSSLHSMESDVSPMQWFEQIKIEHALIGRAAKQLAQDAERDTKQRNLDAARVAERAEMTRPKLPKRKAR